ncbi:MAG: hypothetical protein U5R31_04830 [Acidimicrobiia bacterium]|nr:hypothetical protein [Acidimicrobiia bacterium]
MTLLRTATVLLSALVLQASVLAEVRFWGVAVDLVLVVVIAVGLAVGPGRGAVLGFGGWAWRWTCCCRRPSVSRRSRTASPATSWGPSTSSPSVPPTG